MVFYNENNMDFNSIVNFIKNPEIYKYLIVGIFAAFSVLLLSIIFTSFFGIFYIISIAIAFEITIIWGFFAHDRWTFGSYEKTIRTTVRFAKYNLFALILLGANEAVLIFFTEFIKFHYVLSEGIALIVGFFISYPISKKIIFKN